VTWLLVSCLWVVALWWSSTIAVLHLNGMAPRTFPLTLTGATLAAILGFAGIAMTLEQTNPSGVLAAFASALVVWGWNELTFLTGTITGRRKRPCGPTCRGLRRFRHATEAVIYHELALLICLAVIAWTSREAANQTALLTFLALWLMRLSSKLNIFLGVPNAGAELLPERVEHLKGFFGDKPMNWLFPVSISCLTAALCMLIYMAYESTGAADPSFAVTKYVVLAALVALGTLEHWLLVLPLPATALWQHGLRSRRAGSDNVRSAGLHP
jgi:putative photosynthetic complex assembly protein 2